MNYESSLGSWVKSEELEREEMALELKRAWG